MTIERVKQLTDVFSANPQYMQMAIMLKNGIQQKLMSEISQNEALALSRDIVMPSLKEKVINLCRQSSNPNDELSLYCAALVAGTILKELDNGNTEYVTNQGLLSIINQFA